MGYKDAPPWPFKPFYQKVPDFSTEGTAKPLDTWIAKYEADAQNHENEAVGISTALDNQPSEPEAPVRLEISTTSAQDLGDYPYQIWNDWMENLGIADLMPKAPILGPFKLIIPTSVDATELLLTEEVNTKIQKLVGWHVKLKIIMYQRNYWLIRVCIRPGYQSRLGFMVGPMRQLWIILVSWALETYRGRVIPLHFWMESAGCAILFDTTDSDIIKLHWRLVSAW
jgi:hypothetical protein